MDPPGPTIPGFERAWSQVLTGDSKYHVTVTPHLVLTGGASAPFVARAIANGRQLWTLESSSAVVPASSDDILLVVQNGAVVAVAASDGSRRWTRPFEDEIVVIGAGGGAVIVWAGDVITRLDVKNGQELWARRAAKTAEAFVPPRPAIADGLVVFSPRTGLLAASRLDTGAEEWQVEFEAPVSDISFMEGALYVRVVGRGFFVMNPASSWVPWRLERTEVVGQPALQGDALFISSLDNTVAQHSRSSGARRWRTAIGGRPFAGPVIVGSRLLVPLTFGTFVEIDAASGNLVTTKAQDAAPEQPRYSLEAFAAGSDGTMLFAVTVDLGDVRTLSAFRKK